MEEALIKQSRLIRVHLWLELLVGLNRSQERCDHTVGRHSLRLCLEVQDESMPQGGQRCGADVVKGDVVSTVEQGQDLAAVEIKSGATVNRDFFKNISGFSGRMELVGEPNTVQSHVVFGGEDSKKRSNAQVLSWRHINRILAE